MFRAAGFDEFYFFYLYRYTLHVFNYMCSLALHFTFLDLAQLMAAIHSLLLLESSSLVGVVVFIAR